MPCSNGKCGVPTLTLEMPLLDTKIHYITGDATLPFVTNTEEKVYIVHICNDIGAWGAGFVRALNQRFGVGEGSPVQAYRDWMNNTNPINRLRQGEIQVVTQKNGVSVVNMIAQSGIGFYHTLPPIRYEALRECLTRLRQYLINERRYHPISLHMPRIGSGLAGGKWELIEAVIDEVFEGFGIDIYVYDLPAKSQIVGPPT